jgi:hypothetical protein
MFDIVPFLGGFQFARGSATVSSTPALVIPPNPRRPILYVTNNDASNTLKLYIDPVPQSGLPDVVVQPNTTLAFTWMFDGPMSTYGYICSASAGTVNMSYVEMLWLPEQLGGH